MFVPLVQEKKEYCLKINQNGEISLSKMTNEPNVINLGDTLIQDGNYTTNINFDEHAYLTIVWTNSSNNLYITVGKNMSRQDIVQYVSNTNTDTIKHCAVLNETRPAIAMIGNTIIGNKETIVNFNYNEYDSYAPTSPGVILTFF